VESEMWIEDAGLWKEGIKFPKLAGWEGA